MAAAWMAASVSASAAGPLLLRASLVRAAPVLVRSLSSAASGGDGGRRARAPVAFQETLGKLLADGRITEHDYLAAVAQARRAQVPARRAEAQRIKDLVEREKAEEALDVESAFDFSDAGAEARAELEAKLAATNRMGLWELTEFEREQEELREKELEQAENARLESVDEAILTDQETLPSTDVWNRERNLRSTVTRSLQIALQKDRRDLQEIAVPYTPLRDDEILRFETVDAVYAGPRTPFPLARRVKMGVFVRDLRLPDWAAHKLKLLAATRYNHVTDELVLTEDGAGSREENKRRLLQTFHKLLEESLNSKEKFDDLPLRPKQRKDRPNWMTPPRANAAKKLAMLDPAEEAVATREEPVVVGKGTPLPTL